MHQAEGFCALTDLPSNVACWRTLRPAPELVTGRVSLKAITNLCLHGLCCHEQRATVAYGSMVRTPAVAKREPRAQRMQ